MNASPTSSPLPPHPASSSRLLRRTMQQAITVEPRSTVAWAALQEGRDGLRIRTVAGARTDAIPGLRVELDQGLSGRVFRRRTAHWVDDYRASTSITHEFDTIIAGERLRRMAAAPIAVDGDVVGVFVVGSRDDGRFGTRALTAVHRLAADAAATLSDAASSGHDALADPSERRRRHLRQLSSGALTIREVRARVEGVEAAIGAEAAAALALIAANLRDVEESLRALLEADPDGVPCDEPPSLTPRQRQVLELVGEGLTTRAIAERLHLSPETVRGYVKQALTRLGAHTRAEGIAAWCAPRHG